MAYTDLRQFLSDLGTDLVRVEESVDPRFEVAAVLKALGDQHPAVMFSNVRGYAGVSICGNLLGKRSRLARAFGTTAEKLAAVYLERKGRGIATVDCHGKAPVKEVIKRDPDDLLALLPILTHYEKDAAPFITSGVVLAKDPATGRRAMGIHRMMVHGGNRLGVFLANPPLSQFLENAEKEGKPLEVAVALGLEPATLVAAVVKAGSTGPDKLEIAGALRDEPVELVRAETVDIDVPARAEIVIEGKVLPGVRMKEGPFGENTGYYFTNESPIIEVSAVTHREGFVYPGLCPWTADVDSLLSLAAGTELLWQLQRHVGAVVDLEMLGGTIGFSAVISVDRCSTSEVRRLIQLALSLDKRLKSVTVVDHDVDIRDPREVAWAMATRYQPSRDTLTIDRTEPYVIDPSAVALGSGSKIGFDATKGTGAEYEKVVIPKDARSRAQTLMAGIVQAPPC